MLVLWLDWPTNARVHIARFNDGWHSLCSTISAEWVHQPPPARLLTVGSGARPYRGALVHLGWVLEAPPNRRVCTRCLARYLHDDRQLLDHLEAIGQTIR